MLRRSIPFRHDVLLGIAHFSQRRRLERKRLRRRKLLAGNVALVNGVLFHAEHRPPAFTIQNEQQADLAVNARAGIFLPPRTIPIRVGAGGKSKSSSPGRGTEWNSQIFALVRAS